MAKTKKKNHKSKKKKVSEEEIPFFTFKSSIFISIIAMVSNIVIPLFLSTFGVDIKISILVCNATITALSVAYARYFIDTDRGIGKGFWKTYLGFAILFSVITYFWMFRRVLL